MSQATLVSQALVASWEFQCAIETRVVKTQSTSKTKTQWKSETQSETVAVLGRRWLVCVEQQGAVGAWLQKHHKEKGFRTPWKKPRIESKSNRPIVGVFFRVVTKTCDGFS